ncbi:DMT family transporter [Segnochrobactraceae bacterium EtOH-i3]
MNPSYLLLLGAVICEVIGTTALKLSEGFTRPLPLIVVAAGYGLSFFLLSLTLKMIPMGIAYGIWSGVGIVLISVIGWVWFRQGLDLAALIGLALILAGVLVINLFSASAGH